MSKVFLQPRQVNDKMRKAWLPRRKKDSHKGDYGRLLLLCGSVGYTGAAVLASQAAVRSGAGLVFVGVPESVYPIVSGKLTEPMVFPLPCEDGKLSKEAVPEILKRLERMDACLIGCGLGQSEGTFEVVKSVLGNAHCPVVVDADGINVLQGHIDVLCGAACPVILTPHAGEFQRLGGDFSESRFHEVRKLHNKTGATILLKGHRTLICGEGGCFVNSTGNPGMATGGSGDVLAGIIVSLLGQGLSPIRAAALGAWLHGRAGDEAAKRLGEYGLLPRDLIRRLPQLLK
ncbi:MAG: NAD(P)H-hydrate dehydratase [Oscillospiraceae bacterium]|nr:NAD(P)H-hydrate dehydratase [Oscillospiraceae bacterium]